MDPETSAFAEMGKPIEDEAYASKKETILTNDLGSTFTNPSKRIQWMWNSNTDPFSKSESKQWHPYTDVTNMIIEEAFIAGTDQHEVFNDVAQIKQQHSNHGFFRSDPNFRANHYPVYERTFHNNPAFRLLRRDDHDTSIDTVIGAFAGRLADRYDRFGRDSDWNDE
ncbi:unnamed protein product [Rotaria sordida]|uniref:WWE domain-containing protein n=1 Tax=Rotaria sordida TaxID=392033 RepID=A0A815CPY0_9BILA|nr:unnamed protein product [Rotaria sordida]CAF4084119.1 unnamed protein product [Rotaria sordida]